MRIAITGGHFSPAHAILNEIKDENDVIVIGRKYSFEGDDNESYEYRACKDLGVEFKALQAGRLQRKLTRHSIPSLLRFPTGVIEAIHILRKFNTDVVVTFGGYVGLPVAVASSVLKIPVVLHEQTLKAGLASRLIAKFSSVILISFESSRVFFKKNKVVLTGIPVRSEIFEKRSVVYDKPMIYITGGSTGSHAINESLKDILTDLLEKYIVIHQTGNSLEFNDYEKAIEFRKSLPDQLSKNYTVEQFFPPDKVSQFIQSSSLVIGRSGINTIYEMMIHNAVALLIPLPIGQMNEQKDNAIFFKKIGLGDFIEQKDLTRETFLATIHAMIKENKSYRNNGSRAKNFVINDAVDRVVEQIYIYGKGREQNRKGSTST